MVSSSNDRFKIEPEAEKMYREGLKHYRENRYRTALSYFNKALEIDSGYESALNAKGVALYALCEYDEALTCFNQVLAINPLNDKARKNRDSAQKKLRTTLNSSPGPSLSGESISRQKNEPDYDLYYKKNYFLYIWLFFLVIFAFGGKIGIFIYIIISAVFIYIDSRQINAGIEKGYSIFTDMEPWEWSAFTFLLCILGYPLYLYYRHLIFDINNYDIKEGYEPPYRGTGIKIAGFICIFLLVLTGAVIIGGINEKPRYLNPSLNSVPVTIADFPTLKPTTNIISETPTPMKKVTTDAPQYIGGSFGRNIALVKEIIEKYHATHTYSLNDLYVCGDMSSDVWDMLKTQGINAKIEIGNVDQDISDIKDSNHAWVLAEVAPGSWVALETTGGYLVCSNENYCPVNNPRYYSGWSFDSPKEFKDALDKLKHPCGEGYVLGDDHLCHLSCGGNSYCTGDSICVNGQCKGCDPGYILGSDMKCHEPCGSAKSYCSDNSVCVSGQCRSCDPGYILGSDLKCHEPCGSTDHYCPDNDVCINGKCFNG